MIIESQDTKYECISRGFAGSVNESYICRKADDNSGKYYVVNIIKVRDVARKVIEAFKNTCAVTERIKIFTWKEAVCVVSDYYESRSLERFFLPQITGKQECEEIFQNIVLTCMSEQLPYPLLYLILSQRKFNLCADKSITINYCFDFKKLDMTKTETDCVRECISLLLFLFDAKDEYELASYQVLYKKERRNGYHSFIELYTDLKNAGLPLEKDTLFKKIRRFIELRGNTIYRILRNFSIVVAIIAIVLILSQIFFGDIPILRLFTNTFKVIGNRSLYQ